MQARADGRVTSEQAVRLPFMAPRIQGELHPEGWVDLALWGAGDLGRLRFTPLTGPYDFTPNGLDCPDGQVAVAQSQPVMVIRGVEARRLYPARRCAGWDRQSHPPAETELQAGRRIVRLAWGLVGIDQRGPDLVIAVGAGRGELDQALALSVGEIQAEAEAYGKRCDRMPEADPILRSMVIQGVHAGLSSIRRDEAGQFAGLAAGLAYSAPARTYYRDGYWTLQLLLDLEPDVVRQQLDLLAAGVRADGQAPSGVIVSGREQALAWHARLAGSRRDGRDHPNPKEWWADHFDSPLFFILTLGDYVAATGDHGPVEAHWPVVRRIFERYVALCREGLPRKPRHDRDWADNVYRAGYVAYDLGLWLGALEVIIRLGEHDPDLTKRASDLAGIGRETLDRVLWQGSGWYADYADPDGVTEPHLSLDSLTLIRPGGVSETRAMTLLESCRTRLETVRNSDQPYGDWGIMCAWPAYGTRRDVRSKTAFAYRYHNGSDWPWLDGLYAEERLRRGLGGACYALTRWWEVSLEKGWMGAVEYYSPPWGRGCLLQGWSAMPAAVALRYRDQVLAGD
jgi:hypothetical protein